MNGNLELVLVYKAPQERPLAVARVRSADVLAEAARTALREAESQAEAVAQVDETLGAIEAQEVERLRRVLGMFLPEIA
jgi:hypothetical protein